MDFYFTSDEQQLTRPIQQGGCGLGVNDLANVKRWQQNLDYKFNVHTGYHGSSSGHYIYIRSATRPKNRDLMRIWITGEKAGRAEGNDPNLKNKHTRDAGEVVLANQTLFVQIMENCP